MKGVTISFTNKMTGILTIMKPSPNKPITYIESLVKLLHPLSSTFLTKKGDIVNTCCQDKRQCFLLIKGTVSLHRKSDGLVINSESAPYVIGLTQTYLKWDYFFIHSQDNATLASLDINDAWRLIDENKKWKEASYVILYSMGRIYEHCMNITSYTSYDVIRYQLYELMKEPTTIRLFTSAVSYIQERSFVSRSSIMKILSQLRIGGYIKMNKGVLMEICKVIPLKY